MTTKIRATFTYLSIGAIIFVSCTQKAVKETTIFDTRKIAKASILEDLDEYVGFVKNTHPRIGYTASEKSLDTVVKAIEQEVKDSMSVAEVWGLFARLNPIFNDAHVGLIAPEDIYQEYLSGSGIKMPFTVKIKNDSIFLKSTNVKLNDPFIGHYIESINGIKSSAILARLLPKMRGESRSLQELILSKRFHIFFTMYYGAFKEYVMKLIDPIGNTELITIQPKMQLGGTLQVDNESYYDYEQINDSTAYLKIASFDIENKDTFKHYLDDSFTKIYTGEISNLIIDIGENGGGARDLSDLLLDYLTDSKYSATSKIEARVTEANKSLIPNAKLGDVVTVPYPNWIYPENKSKVFNGNVFVLISEQSYSQAIVFATIVQDFNLGKIVGEETAGKANQTGQVQNINLKHTGFKVYSPIYIFYRVKASDELRGVIPDFEVSYAGAKTKALSLINHK